MKTLFSISLLFLSLFAEADYWTQKANFPATARGEAFSFSIGSKGYLGTGYIHDTSSSLMFSDFWQYDQSTNTWSQKADFGGGQWFQGVGFSIENKGYAVTGFDSAGIGSEFWEYDTTMNIWTQKATFLGQARTLATGFSIGRKGYIGIGGSGPALKDFWQYDQLADTWTQKTDFSGGNRAYSAGFSIGGYGYMGTGADGGNLYDDFWKYDTTSNSWSQVANFSGGPIAAACSFSVGNKGYIGIGYWGNYHDWWEYDPIVNQWNQKSSCLGTGRIFACSFSIGLKGYIAIGDTLNTGCCSFSTNDVWEYTPDSIVTGINELSSSAFQFYISPNPAKDIIICSFASSANKKVEISIFDGIGRKVFSQQLQTVIDIRDFSEGLYFIVATNGEEKAVRKFVKE